MDMTALFYKAATVPPRRTGSIFTTSKFRPRLKSPRRFKIPKPKWMK